MKKTIFTLVVALLATVMSASAMNYEQARNEAIFLTDKMAYELNLTDAQYEAAYEINLDYLMGVTGVNDVFGTHWERRNLDLSYILYTWQWEVFCAATYFYRPLYWNAGHWHFGIYTRYPRRDYLYFGRPHFYATYRGGHAWHRNGGHSFYLGRDSHFRPALPQNHTHFGMRNSFDRGDYRSSRPRSSTHVTGRQDNHPNNRPTNGGNFSHGNKSSNNNRGSSNGHFSSSSSSKNNRPAGGNIGTRNASSRSTTSHNGGNSNNSRGRISTGRR